MWVQSLGWEGPLEEGRTTHSSILAWRTPRTEVPGGLQSTGLQRSAWWATVHGVTRSQTQHAGERNASTSSLSQLHCPSAPPSSLPLSCLTCVLRWHLHWCTCTDLGEGRRKGQPRVSSTWLEAQSSGQPVHLRGRFTCSPGPRRTPARRRRWMHTAVPSSSSHSTTPPLAMTSGRFKAAHSCSRVHGLCALGCWAARSMACSVREFELRMRQ